MVKRSNISARRDWGDEETVKEPEKDEVEGKGGEERGGVLETRRRKEGRRH